LSQEGLLSYVMLADRDYMRSEPAGGGPRVARPISATTLLIIINVGVFLLQGVFHGSSQFRELFPLSVEGLRHGYIWQLLTYQFLHGSLMHILLNCWGIFVFGRVVEQALGRRRFWALYLTSGVAGGILQVVATLSWHGHFGGVVMGASAGLFGLIAAFATMLPHAELMLIFPPVTLKAKTLLTISAGMAIAGMLFPNLLGVIGLGANVAHAAHLGGMLGGVIYIRMLRQRSGAWPGEPPAPRARPLFGFGSGKPAKPGGSTIIEVEEVSDDYVANKVDPILDKISKHGIHSLTERERKTLDEARKKMGRG